MKVTIGGDRLGSGKKMDTTIHNYGRSSHNLNSTWKSTIAPGVLYPFMKLVGLPGDTFDIDLETMVKTLPTRAPLFGSFKLQLDVFKADIRLYQGILHNNPINIGLKMNQVKLPKLLIPATGISSGYTSQDQIENTQVNGTALMKYLGLSGIGLWTTALPEEGYFTRAINAVPALAYFDIFKNYYANKQEEYAYQIVADSPEVTESEFCFADTDETIGTNVTNITITLADYEDLTTNSKFIIGVPTRYTSRQNAWEYLKNYYRITAEGNVYKADEIAPKYFNWETTTPGYHNMGGTNCYTFTFTLTNEAITNWEEFSVIGRKDTTERNIKLEHFKLENIDKMREEILKHTQLGSTFYVGDSSSNTNFMPYNTLIKVNSEGIPHNIFPMNGLLVKTYQSDIFNNWLQTEFITGSNGIAEITSIDTTGDSFTIDALNLAQKIYNMLNRIAIAGGTYQDWQKAVYTDNINMHIETPIWCGGMSTEVVFEEVVSTAQSEGEPLATLAGKGKQMGKKGGHMHIKVTEPCYIMGIVSLTPRIDYTQGNDWDVTDLDSVDDLHKPELDGIGFQDLIIEQMAWWDTKLNGTITRNSAGKVPAWINYMTDVDKAYGEFSDSRANYMILSRNYTMDLTDRSVQDVTTYIDPSKYNYVFAYDKLDAQNFWVMIGKRITARRKMSAKIIPNI